jgi:hypothetical protein
MVLCVDGSDNELVDVVTPLSTAKGDAPDGGELLTSCRGVSNVASMPAATGGRAVVPVVR